MQIPDTDWIFFDCFNTLIDDFDERGEEGSLRSIPKLAAEMGFFATPEDFLEAYERARDNSMRRERESYLGDRLRQVLKASPRRFSGLEIEAAVTRLLTTWEPEFVQLLRLTPGVVEMLEHWAPRRSLGVVANSFLPGLPARYLKQFGLDRYFRFVIDSASFGFKKPNPLLVMEGLSRAGLGPSDGNRVLAIGDRHDLDIVSALDLGMHGLHFNRSRIRPGAEPTPEGVPAIYDWSEFR